MPEKQVFPLAEINALRKLAAKRAEATNEGTKGWSISPLDPRRVVDVFETLRVRSGWMLGAYQYRTDREGGNGNGFVWALPEGGSLPEPGDPANEWGVIHIGQPFSHLPFSAPKPPNALVDLREVIEGDDSPLSYLNASICARELHEFGAIWHGRHWGEVELITDPAVEQVGDVVKVHLYCWTRLGCEGTFTYVDTYQAGSYVFETEETDVVVTGGGYVH